MSSQPFKGNIPPPQKGSGSGPAGSGQAPKSKGPVPLRERRTQPKGRAEFVLLTPEKQQQLLEANASTTFEADRRAVGGSSQDRGLMTLLGAVLSLLLGAGAGWGLGRLQRPEAAPVQTVRERPLAAAPEEEISLTEKAAQAARATLNALAGARSTEERLSWVLDPERVKPVMEKYYGQNVRDDRLLAEMTWDTMPVRPEDMDLGISVLGSKPSPQMDGRASLLMFRRDPRDPGKYRLDWEIYVQQRENTLARFLNDPASPPAVFRVYLERKHLFDENGESVEGCLARCLGGFRGEVFVEENSPLRRRLKEDLKWGQPRLATVELEWRKPPGDGAEKPRPHISRFFSWQLAGLQVEPETKLGETLIPPPEEQNDSN